MIDSVPETPTSIDLEALALERSARKARNAAMAVIAWIVNDPQTDLSEAPWLIGRLGMAMLGWNEVVGMVWPDTINRITTAIERAQRDSQAAIETFRVLKFSPEIVSTFHVFEAALAEANQSAETWRHS